VGAIEIEVQDNGFGIEEAMQQKVFERFVRIKDESTRYITGTGLGLPIVKNLVEGMGGKVELESKPGEGSIFRVLLPVGAEC
jgi:two-component system phosphate regulon sensor histidine kinase PhoR